MIIADNNNYDSIICIYCREWIRSTVLMRASQEQESESETKKKKKERNQRTTRKCDISKRSVTSDSIACKYFIPSQSFYCHKNYHFVNFLACLNRRNNAIELQPFERCRRCKQFDLEVKPIIKKYWVNAEKIIVPQPKRVIKRREKPKEVVKKRVIKRRKESKPKRVIKRRSKSKPKRVIKRRI